MKKALLIATTLMALGLPAQAIQLNQVNQGHQDQLSQQTQPVQVIATPCKIVNSRKICNQF
ncbi:MAG: hypothetical protein DSM106950_34000 [Stigonema ocellatum SAG 48.90 = DSM 106950]|nr:hypothetical protein [Stigonema ocellatum SAG 48.90 = DSM 106950]